MKAFLIVDGAAFAAALEIQQQQGCRRDPDYSLHNVHVFFSFNERLL
jgi:hypothetical protein